MADFSDQRQDYPGSYGMPTAVGGGGGSSGGTSGTNEKLRQTACVALANLLSANMSMGFHHFIQEAERHAWSIIHLLSFLSLLCFFRALWHKNMTFECMFRWTSFQAFMLSCFHFYE